jgi:preprotein translocase subunit YajC
MILGSMWVPLAAQTAAPSGSANSSWFFLEIGILAVAFYFLFIRPQQKQRKQHETAIRALKKGDEVVTAGGVVGEVIFIKMGSKDGQPEATMDDRITIKSGESRIIVERGRIARISTRTGETSSGVTS